MREIECKYLEEGDKVIVTASTIGGDELHLTGYVSTADDEEFIVNALSLLSGEKEYHYETDGSVDVFESDYDEYINRKPRELILDQ